MRIIIVAFKDTDISKGLTALLEFPGKSFTEILAPKLSDEFDARIQALAEAFDLPVNPLPEDPLHTIIQHDDTVAFVWDDTEQIHRIYTSIEDFGLECWDVSDGIASIQTLPEEEDLEEMLVGSFLNFMDHLVDYVTENVLAILEAQLDEEESE